MLWGTIRGNTCRSIFIYLDVLKCTGHEWLVIGIVNDAGHKVLVFDCANKSTGPHVLRIAGNVVNNAIMAD